MNTSAAASRFGPVPQTGDLVVVQAPNPATCFTVRQLPGPVQFSASTLEEAVGLARSYARRHTLDLWSEEPDGHHLLESYRWKASCASRARYEVDRSSWPRGPWEAEPDRLDFRYAGLRCLLLRNERGVWCGYVGVPPGHPAYEKGRNDLPGIHVHGGLTYAAHGDVRQVSRIRAAGEPLVLWWVGFDCAHHYDLAPGQTLRSWGAAAARIAAMYRTLDYARAETERLAESLGSPSST